MARQNGSIELLPVVPSLPVPGANTGGFFRFGGHVYFDTGTAVVQIDQQALLSTLTNTVPSTPSDGTTLGLFDFNAARPESAIVDFRGFLNLWRVLHRSLLCLASLLQRAPLLQQRHHH